MLVDYLPLFIFLMLAIIFAGFVIILSSLVGRKTRSREKLMTYECGLDPIGNARKKFSVKFFIVAILFVLFDIELIFLFPWAVAYTDLGLFGFIEMLVFLLVVVAGLFYSVKRGALEWN
jgi:NADH-quinone oxidoreductase subunit A